MAIYVAAKNVNEYCFYSEMSLKNVVHLRILGKVLKSYYIALIFFNVSAKFEKYLIILKKYRYIKFGYLRCRKKCQWILFLLRSVIKECSPSQNVGKVLKSYYIALILFNVSAKIWKILNYIEKIWTYQIWLLSLQQKVSTNIVFTQKCY